MYIEACVTDPALRERNECVEQNFKRLSDQLIVLMKQGNACGGKGLAEETLRQEHIKGYGG